MSKRRPKPTTWQGRIKAEVLRDKKKTGALAALTLVTRSVNGGLVLAFDLPYTPS